MSTKVVMVVFEAGVRKEVNLPDKSTAKDMLPKMDAKGIVFHQVFLENNSSSHRKLLWEQGESSYEEDMKNLIQALS